jgi:hypothetical protein
LPFLLLALLLGCGGEKQTRITPPVILGAIEGQVLGAGAPVPATISLRSVRESDQPRGSETEAEVETDSLGRYHVDLPPGRYFLSVRTESGASAPYVRDGVLRIGDPDTVVVGAEVVTADFVGGALTIRVETPPELEGLTLGCFLDGEVYAGASAEGACTDGVAEFRFPWLLPQGYTAWLDRIPFAGELWLPGTRRMEDATEITVEPGALATAAGRIGRPARISGTVRGSWQALHAGTPSVSAFVSAPRYSSGFDRLASTEVGANGEFSLEVLAPESVRVAVGFAGAVWIGGPDFAGASVFVVQPGDEVSGLSVTESGLLCELSSSGMPLSGGASLQVFDSEGRLAASASTQTGTSLVPIPGLVAGTYSLRVEHQLGRATWAAQWFDEQPSRNRATPITVTGEGEVVPIRIELRRGGAIRGTVLHLDGKAASADILVVAPGSNTWQRAGESDAATGAYEITGLEDGEYRIGSMWSHEFPAGVSWYPGTPDQGSAAVIAIKDGAEVDGIEWRVP